MFESKEYGRKVYDRMLREGLMSKGGRAEKKDRNREVHESEWTRQNRF